MLKQAWERRHHQKLLFLFYEEVNADKKEAVLKIADFIGKKLTEQELEKLLNHIDIENFRHNKSVNNDHFVDVGKYAKTEKYSFIRQGKNGSWKDLFPENLVPEIDEWIKKELSQIPDFEMPESWKNIMELK
ncbi:hypothetical protein HHI36_013979 [Cryptolaemus montrouzieri]|uniref:Sulfotransferase domain-containing protein n=1 Tax=Cryptolaemus montrouzieri TaxID=559131 RepID=A0ABD2N1E5_9CUCU